MFFFQNLFLKERIFKRGYRRELAFYEVSFLILHNTVKIISFVTHERKKSPHHREKYLFF